MKLASVEIPSTAGSQLSRPQEAIEHSTTDHHRFAGLSRSSGESETGGLDRRHLAAAVIGKASGYVMAVEWRLATTPTFLRCSRGYDPAQTAYPATFAAFLLRLPPSNGQLLAPTD